MRFKTDENLPLEVAELLRGAGYDALTVHDQGFVGMPDDAIAAACRREGHILIMLDTDFADVRRYPPRDRPGIIVLRLERQDKPHVLSVCKRVAQLLRAESPANRLWVEDENRIRVRP